jgi:xylan 1,4-beta-xylosidase
VKKTNTSMRLAVLISILLAGATELRVSAAAPADVTIAADFGVPVDYPLSKAKFGGFNSGMVPLSRYQRDIKLYDEIRLPSLRLDLIWGARWGGWLRPPVTGTAGDLRYDFSEMDALASLLNEHGVLPYWSYCYVPSPLQSKREDYRSPPTDVTRWGEVLRAFARHYRERGIPIGYQEVFNEPDNRDFYRGGLDSYLELYREGARGIRAGDPDAVVGGPALAFTDAWVAPFLDFVSRERLPLDFFSFHFYPDVPYKSKTVGGVIADMRCQLAKHPEFATAEMHLNEYNSYRIDYPQGGCQDRYPAASALLHDYLFFLSQPDLAHVNWAQIQDSGGGNYSGMISMDGHRKAVFNAAALYARMPVDRRLVTVQGSPEVEGLASTDARYATLLFWNRTGADHEVKLTLDAVPFPRGTLRVYRIDAGHASWGDKPDCEQLAPVETLADIPTSALAWSGALPANGVVCLELKDASAPAPPARLPAGRIVRVMRCFPNRDSRSYADFDRRSWTARLGMATESQAEEQIGIVAEGLAKRLTARVQTDGEIRRLDANSLLGLRLDYQVGTDYKASVLFHGPSGPGPDLYDANRDTPVRWGTKRQPDHVVIVKDLAQYDFSPAEHAPEGWTGRVLITFIMQNSGQGTRATLQLAGW